MSGRCSLDSGATASLLDLLARDGAGAQQHGTPAVQSTMVLSMPTWHGPPSAPAAPRQFVLHAGRWWGSTRPKRLALGATPPHGGI